MKKHQRPKQKPKLDLYYQGQTPAGLAYELNSKIGANFPNIAIDVQYVFTARNWQLTKAGFQLLADEYEFFKIQLNDYTCMTGRILLKLNKAVNSPWIIINNILYLFDNTEAFAISIAGNSISQYLDCHADES